MLIYDKCKDATPQSTIRKIKSILQNVGLKTSVTWTEQQYDNIFSNRVTLEHTSLGTNGKGTDQEYALCSGYAELLERIENGTILIGYQSPKLINSFGFIHSPDEVMVPIDVLASQDDPLTRFIFEHYNVSSADEKKSCLKKLPRLNDADPSAMRCIPFSEPSQKRVVYIPLDIMLPIYGSNGMAAGNTMEEALVQGLSEILERYANKAVIDGVVPPEVPRAYWDNLPIGRLIHDIEKNGRYHISIRDCSLGKDIPATAIVISDLEKGQFGIHFSCHPSFEVSVERTLTEALQGKKLESFTSMNVIGDSQMCCCVDNYPNLMKIGFGAYPISFFAGQPSYEFKPRDEWRGLTNREMLNKLLQIIATEGYDVLIRDASHLKFPAYHVIIPGMSEMFFSNGRRFRELNTLNRVVSSMVHFPDLSKAEEDRLMLLMRYKECSTLENQFGWITTLPLVGTHLTTERVRAHLHFKRKEYQEASGWFRDAANQEEDSIEKGYLLCASEYSRLLAIGADAAQAFQVVKHYFPEKTVMKVFNTFRDPEQVMIKAFQPFGCDHCETCPHAGVNCEYPDIENIMFKIKSALAKSTVSQEKLLEQLTALH